MICLILLCPVLLPVSLSVFVHQSVQDSGVKTKYFKCLCKIAQALFYLIKLFNIHGSN